MDLLSKKCIPCEGNVKPFTLGQINEYKLQISNEWLIVEDKNIFRIKKRFKFADFKAAIGFVNKVAALAESEGHHPNIFVFYNRVDIELYTHVIKGLHENDFIMAAKIDNI